jgi:hypothetical protein
MKAVILKDELYPWYVLETERNSSGAYWAYISNCEKAVEVPDELVDRYNEAVRVYFAVQDELNEVWRKADES